MFDIVSLLLARQKGKKYDWLDKQNETVSDEHTTQEEHGEDVSMSDSAATRIAEGNKCPSPPSNSAADGMYCV